jgi:hypothetical protein
MSAERPFPPGRWEQILGAVQDSSRVLEARDSVGGDRPALRGDGPAADGAAAA